MPNNYTINLITSRVELATNLLDDTVSFPSAYKLVITPNPGVNLLAREFKIGTKNLPMRLSYNGDVNSHTEWPSKFQWIMDDLGNVDTGNISGLAEFPTFYKIVFQDSNNLTNDSNWILNPDTDGNQIYVWIYFGKNEITSIDPPGPQGPQKPIGGNDNGANHHPASIDPPGPQGPQPLPDDDNGGANHHPMSIDLPQGTQKPPIGPAGGGGPIGGNGNGANHHPKIDLDINRQKYSPLTEIDTLNPTITSTDNNINSFNI